MPRTFSKCLGFSSQPFNQMSVFRFLGAGGRVVEWFRAYVLNLEFLCSNPLLYLSSGSVSRLFRIHSLEHSQCSNLRPFCAPLLVSSQGFQLKRLPAVYHHLQDFLPPSVLAASRLLWWVPPYASLFHTIGSRIWAAKFAAKVTNLTNCVRQSCCKL